MTIICIKNGVVAADTATWCGDVQVVYGSKLVTSLDGAIGAVTGVTADAFSFRRWFAETHCPAERRNPGASNRPLQKREREASHAVWLELDGSIWHWLADDFGPYSAGEHECAVGSCEDFAKGLMLGGMTAREAVVCCIERAAYAGGDDEVRYLPVRHEAGDDIPF